MTRTVLTVPTGTDGPATPVSAVVYHAESSDRSGRAAPETPATLILGHGAGADQSSPFMVAFATALAARGVETATFNFLYTERGRRLPDPGPTLEATYRSVIAAVHATRQPRRLFVGGKSMGGRIATQVVAADAENTLAVAGVVALGYPLHPPGKPHQLRVAHLASLARPLLIVQGGRDPFGSADEVRAAVAGLTAPVRVFEVEGGDHSFAIGRKSAEPLSSIYARVQDEIVRWLAEV